MMLKLVDVFGYLSVILRAGTLVFQSLLLGGVLFVLWIARPTSEIADASFERVRSSSLRMLRIAAIGLAVVQAFYLYVNSAVLMATAEIGLRDVVGANFFISGSVDLCCCNRYRCTCKAPGASPQESGWRCWLRWCSLRR